MFFQGFVQVTSPSFFETLEPRCLLAASAIKINFQTPGTPNTPAGYFADVGDDYGDRGNGRKYGWQLDQQSAARDRNAKNSPDERYDTFTHFGKKARWAVQVPNGSYNVRVVAGDPSYFNSVYRINVEGLESVSGTPSSGKRWLDKIIAVNVTDGAITLTSGVGASNNKISFIEITPLVGTVQTVPPQALGVLAQPVAPKQINLSWVDASTNELGFQIYRKQGNGGWIRRATVPANVTSFVDAKVQPGTTYAYRIRPANNVGNGAYSNISRVTTPGDVGSPVGTNIEWTTLAPSPIGRAEALRAVVDNKLYVLGGFSGSDGPVARSDVFDPKTNTWTRIADMPRRLTHAGVAVFGRNIFVAGGYVGTGPGYQQQFGTTEVWRFNVDTKQWTASAALPKAVAGGGLVALGNEFHWISGNNSARQDIADHYILNVKADGSAVGNWSSGASLPTARSHFGYAALNGKIYVIAGQSGNDSGLTTRPEVHVWDPATPDRWTRLADLSAPLSHIASSTFVLGNRIIVAGGERDHGEPVSTVYAYDPANNDWEKLTNLPAPRFSGVAAGIDGAIIFTTGGLQTTTWRGEFVG